MKIIFTHNSFLPILVDDEDFERIKKYSWNSSGKNHTTITRQQYTNGKAVYISIANEVMQDYESTFDHKNREPFDNQKINLRVSNGWLNAANKEKYALNTTSIYKGVRKKRDKWTAQIQFKSKNIHIGTFLTEKAAALAYNKKAIELVGEFACLNETQQLVQQ